MSEGTLMLHCGAREVDRTYLANVPTPAPQRRWHPVGHEQFITACDSALAAQGFVVERAKYGLSGDDQKLFAVYDLANTLIEGVTLAVGLRNSLNQTFPLGFCGGQRVFVCDNLAFSAELMARRKHTRLGLSRFQLDIGECVQQLPSFIEQEQRRLEAMQQFQLTDRTAESIILRGYKMGAISTRQLPVVISQWEQPDYERFLPRTLWSLYNAFTFALMDRRDPQAHASCTMRLNVLVNAELN